MCSTVMSPACAIAAEYDQVLRSRSLVPGRDSIVSRVLLERKVVHIVDAETEAGYDFPEAINIGRVPAFSTRRSMVPR